MAFTSTVTDQSVFGNKMVAWGTWDAGGVTSGDIDTSLQVVEFISLTAKGSSAVPKVIGMNETLPCAGNAVTIDLGTSIDVDGYWWAFGY